MEGQMKTLQLTKKQLETIGSHSLQGILAEKGLIPNDEKAVRVEFETFSLEQCRKNDGPDWVLIPEYVVHCLCESVLSLAKQGYKVEIGEWHQT
jgi:hypothetical protein